MAGTDHRRQAVTTGPAIILVEPQLGENIGTAARAMMNCGLDDLRLVRPRDGWPSDRAIAAASGADAVWRRRGSTPMCRRRSPTSIMFSRRPRATAAWCGVR